MTDQEVFDIAALIHHGWSQEMQKLQVVKRETDDGSPDWSEFHAIRFKNHTARIEHLANLKTVFLKEHPLFV